MRVKKIEIPIYYNNLIIVVPDTDDFSEVVKKYNIKEDVSGYGAFVWTRENNNSTIDYLICIPQNCSNHLIAHEVVHLVNALYINKGIQLDRHNDEPQAYLTGWFFKEIEKFLITK